MPSPVVAIVGRPNVGKSTLFNCLTHGRRALVADMPGVTRDRLFGTVETEGRSLTVVDTGGLDDTATAADSVAALGARQAQTAIAEADLVLLVVDARAGLLPGDRDIAERLRRQQKTVVVAVNKSDGMDETVVAADFHILGWPLVVIAAVHRRGIRRLLVAVLELLDVNVDATAAATQGIEGDTQAATDGVRVAVLGRPNAGKSTLINRLLGEERVLACDEPGTTRDSIFVPFRYRGREYTLIDTAGIRRRANIKEQLEQLAVMKSFRAMQEAHVVILTVDAQVNIADHELKLLGQIIKSGRALIIAVNKWDGLSPERRNEVKRELNRRLTFVDYAERRFISALHGSGVGLLMQAVNRCHRAATHPLPTAELTEALRRAVHDHPPPVTGGRRVKLRYAHLGAHNPPTIIIHGNRTDRLPASYRRYLEKYYRKRFKLSGTPVRLLFKTGDNPFQKTED